MVCPLAEVISASRIPSGSSFVITRKSLTLRDRSSPGERFAVRHALFGRRIPLEFTALSHNHQ